MQEIWDDSILMNAKDEIHQSWNYPSREKLGQTLPVIFETR